MTYIATNWYDLSINSNKLTQSYINGFIDVSNNIVGRENLLIQNENNNTNFGLGTKEPLNNIHVVSNNPGIRFDKEQMTNENDIVGKFNFVSPIRNNIASGSIRCEKINNNHSLVFATGGESNYPLDRMTITSTGNVGIGTTIPSHKLEVSGNILVSGNIHSNYGLDITSDGYMNLGLDSNNIKFNINNSNGENTMLCVDNNTMRVGIKTNVPANKLDVVGSVKTTNQIQVKSGITNGVGTVKTKTVENANWSNYQETGTPNGTKSGMDWQKHSDSEITLDEGLWVVEASIKMLSNTADAHNVWTFGLSMGTDTAATNIALEQHHNHDAHLFRTSLGWEAAVLRIHLTGVKLITPTDTARTLSLGYFISTSNSDMRITGYTRATKVIDAY